MPREVVDVDGLADEVERPFIEDALHRSVPRVARDENHRNRRVSRSQILLFSRPTLTQKWSVRLS